MCRRRQSNRGFTLVELLVVITIIGMLMGLLLPAVQAARESGRRNTCLSTLHNLAIAAQAYEGQRKSFPGFRMQMVNGNTSAAGFPVSWALYLMPQLERVDIWNQWKIATGLPGTGTNAAPAVSVKLLTCPSDPPNTFTQGDPTYGGPSSYIVNGFVMQDGRGLSLDFITGHDGSSMTLLFSENVQQDQVTQAINYHNWWNTLMLPANYSQLTTDTTRPFYQAVTFGYSAPASTVANAACNGFGYAALSNPPGVTILPAYSCGYNYPYLMTSATNANGNISSAHGSGSNVAFCDGHAYFLRNDILPVTYEQLVNPNDMGLQTKYWNASSNAVYAAPLDESMY